MPAVIALWIAIVAQAGAPAADVTVRHIVDSPRLMEATAFIDSDYERFVRELIALTEIPAPPLKEERRARAFLDMLKALGLADVEMDQEGNVMGVRRGTSSQRVLAVVAHLDTVFPEGTDVKVKRDGTRLMAPGVGDDSRGLALMLSVIRAMNAAALRTA